MSWNGSGVYSRGYASWTNDANNNLPISATKFDQEDNDFAAGINNCLCKDGQNSPTAALTWTIANASPLNLLRQTDGNVFTAGRASGTNNPALQVGVYDTLGVTLNVTNGVLELQSAGGTFFTGSLAGGVQITAPTATATAGLIVNGAAGAYALYVLGSATSGSSYGALIHAGTSAADTSFAVANQAGSQTFIQVRGDGQTFFFEPVTLQNQNLYINAGACLIYGPTSGQAFAVNNNPNTEQFLYIPWNGGVFIGNPPAGVAALNVVAGTSGNVISANSQVGSQPVLAAYGPANANLVMLQADQSGQSVIQFFNPASTNDMALYSGATELGYFGTGGAAFGGNSLSGAGTVNANGFYQSNYPIYPGIPQNAQGGSYTVAIADDGRHILMTGTGNTLTLPSNASLALPAGYAVTIVVGSGVSTTIACGDTLTWAPNNSTGSRTLTGPGVATAFKVSATQWFITGVNIS